jgi:hypothetical protein
MEFKEYLVELSESQTRVTVTIGGADGAVFLTFETTPPTTWKVLHDGPPQQEQE